MCQNNSHLKLEDVIKMGFEKEVELKDQEKQFAQVPAYIICDVRISAMAKTVLSYVILRSGITHWKIRKVDIESHMKEGEKPINRAFGELEKHGYLIQSPVYYNENGHRDRRYKFFQDPKNNKEYKGELPNGNFYERVIKKSSQAGEPKRRTQQHSVKTSTPNILKKMENGNINIKKYEDNVDEFNRVEGESIEW